MKSIRRTIMFWALPGLALLWISGGVAVVIASRAAMLAEIDRDNLALSREVRMLTQGRRGFGTEVETQLSKLEGSGMHFFQAWDVNGQVLLKSPSLGSSDLPLLEVSGRLPESITRSLDDNRMVRLLVTQFGASQNRNNRQGGAGAQPVIIAIACDLIGFRTHSLRVVAAVAVTGLLGIGVTSLLLIFALHRGLRPLQELGTQAAGINAGSLSERFGVGQAMPRELQPIVSRLNSLMERLESGFERERRFSGDLAHELRSPLAELRLKTDIATRWPEERTEALTGEIDEVVGRLERVVETLLQLARVESGGNHFVSEPIVLTPLIESAWERLGSMTAQRRLTKAFSWPQTKFIDGDATLWEHIIDNLLSNAATYACAGSQVRVEALEDGLLVSNSVELLDQQSVEHLFERFWRGDGAHSDPLHCGLGLSLVRACAEAMGYTASAKLEEDAMENIRLMISVRRHKSAEHDHS